MGFLSFGSRPSRYSQAPTTAAALSMCPAAASSDGYEGTALHLGVVEQRLRNALWSFFAGDALAAPTHWFYGGQRQVQQYYGPRGIVGYTKPSFELAGSILNKSDPNGGGRAKSSVGGGAPQKSIIGDVINHGKLGLWNPQKQIHYHATLQAGENTLETQLGRVLMRSVVASGGTFDPDHFREAYVTFMTTPGSHNDAYASTCHRMFFSNLVHRNLPPEQCPDNDGHNVDTVDGLVLPTVAALGAAARAAAAQAQAPASDSSALDEAARVAVLCAGVTRKSPVLESAAAEWGKVVGTALWNGGGPNLARAAEKAAAALQLRRPRVSADVEMTACYLSGALPALLDDVVTADALRTPVWTALLRNANAGGENVHRGSCLGAVLGAAATTEPPPLDPVLVRGLHDRTALEREIDAFVEAVLLRPPTPTVAAAAGSQAAAEL